MGKGETTGSSTTEPWAGQRGHLENIFNTAQGLYGQPLQPYGGTTIAGFTAPQVEAQEATLERARSGSDLTKTSKELALETLRGDYLTPESNPYLNYYIEKAYESSLPYIDTEAQKAGRYGSGAWALLKGRTMGDIASNIYGGAYEGERGRQMQAMGLAPSLAESDYSDIAKIAAVGEEKQAMDQALIDEAIAKHEFEQMEPWERLGMYLQMVEGNYGSSVVSDSYTRPYGAVEPFGRK